jgi:hypothetical protein
VKLSSLAHLYRVRACAAAAGGLCRRRVAAGIALLFASETASETLSSSVGELDGGLWGERHAAADHSRAPGIPRRAAEQVGGLTGVRLAAALLEVNANAIDPSGSESGELVGADASLS